MTEANSLRFLKAYFPEKDWPLLAAAFSIEPLVLKALKQPGFVEKAHHRLSNQINIWTPGNLALLTLENSSFVSEILLKPEGDISWPIPQSLQQQAIHLFLQAQRGELTVLSNLEQAGLLALALHERMESLHSHYAHGGGKQIWSKLLDELRQPALFWYPALTCLFSYLKDRMDFLNEMFLISLDLTHDNSYPTPKDFLLLYLIFSHPAPPEQQLEILKSLWTNNHNNGQSLNIIALLDRISQYRPEMAKELASWLVEQVEPTKFTAVDKNKTQFWPLHIARANQMIHQAVSYRHIGQPEQTIDLIEQATEGLRQITADLEAYKIFALLAASDCGDEIQNALKNVQTIIKTPLLQELEWKVGLHNINVLTTQEEQIPNPYHLLSQGWQALQSGEKGIACQKFLQALEIEENLSRDSSAIEQCSEGPVFSGSVEVEIKRARYQRQADLAKGLFEVQEWQSALSAARLALKFCPEQPDLLQIVSTALNHLGDYEQAVEVLELACLYLPNHIEMRRNLADNLERIQCWESAYQEWQAIIDADESANVRSNDYHHLAICSLAIHQPARAIEACQQALQINPEDGQAYALLGSATQQLGENITSLDYYERAIQYAPYLTQPWLQAAQLHNELNRPDLALETLQAATRVNPNAPEIQLALGEALLARQSPTQALTALKTAYHLYQKTPKIQQTSQPTNNIHGLRQRIATHLGNTLRNLGHLAESRHVLEESYLEVPPAHRNQFPELAYAYAQVLLEQEEFIAARHPLEVVLQSQGETLAPSLDYARVLLETRQQVEIAKDILERIKEKYPDHLQARILYGEALAACGQHEKALPVFIDSLESKTNMGQTPHWKARLAYDLGCSALVLGQTATGLASLQEAIQAAPRNPAYHRRLAEAYQIADLPIEAWRSAQNVLELASDHLDTILWFARMAIRLTQRLIQRRLPQSTEADIPGERQPSESKSNQMLSEALKALNAAQPGFPDSAELLIRKGEVHSLLGQSDQAVRAYQQILEIGQPKEIEQTTQPESQQIIVPWSAYLVAAERLLTLNHKGLAQRLALLAAYQASQADLSQTSFEELQQLAAICQRADQSQAALAALDRAIQVRPHDVACYQIKVKLLRALDQPEAALATIEKALAIVPQTTDTNTSSISFPLYQAAAEIYQAQGSYPEGLVQIAQALNLSDKLPAEILPRDFPYTLLALGAEMWRSLLRPRQARAMLQRLNKLPVIPSGTALDSPGALAYHCLGAELALEEGDEVEAAAYLTTALKISAGHPRSLALQARMLQRQNADGNQVSEQAKSILKAALQQTDDTFNHPLSSSELLSLGMAAVENYTWDAALSCVDQAIEVSPEDPFTWLSLIRCLTWRAEEQHLCRDLQIIAHAPGEASLDEDSQKKVVSSLDTLTALSQKYNDVFKHPEESSKSGNHSDDILHLWHQRALAAFDLLPPEKLNWRQLPYTNSDTAAHLAWVRRRMQDNSLVFENSMQQPDIELNNLATSALQKYPKHEVVLIQAALVQAATSSQNPDALLTARAITQLIGKHHNPRLAALSQALLAFIALRCGDESTSLAAIHAALALWPNEARWHSLAAKLLSSAELLPADGVNQAAIHLEEAIRLEPNHLPHYLALGHHYICWAQDDMERIQNAVRVLEKGLGLDEKSRETWIALAEAHLAAYKINHDSSELAQATQCTQKALKQPDKSATINYLSDNGINLADVDFQLGMMQAHIALEQNLPVQALEHLHKIFRSKSGNGGRSPLLYDQAILLEAQAYEALGELENAIASLENVLSRQPVESDSIQGCDARLQLELARLLYLTRGQEEALPILHQITQSVLAMGNGYTDCQTALRLAQLLAEVGQTQSAIQIAQQAIQNAANQPISRSLLSMLHHLLGQQLRESGQLDQAVHHLSQSIQLDPQAVNAYIDLGYTYQKQRQFLKAQRIFEEATRAAPQNPRPFLEAGLAYKEAKDYEAAENHLRKATNLSPGDAYIRKQLAVVLAINALNHSRRVASKLKA